MSLWMIPFVLFWGAVEWIGDQMGYIAPVIGMVIGVICAIAAMLSVLALIIVSRTMLPARRQWVQVVGRVLTVVESLAITGFAVLAVLSFGAVALLS